MVYANHAKNYETVFTSVKVMQINCGLFSGHGVVQ